jgi:hypothetical protein
MVRILCFLNGGGGGSRTSSPLEILGDYNGLGKKWEKQERKTNASDDNRRLSRITSSWEELLFG